MNRRALLMTLTTTAIGACALAFVACGGSDDAKPTTTPTHAASAASPAASATTTASTASATTTASTSASATPSSTSAVTTTSTATTVAATPTTAASIPTPVPPTPVPPTAVPTAAGPLTASVGVAESSVFSFTPANVTIAAGGTVSFAWSGTNQFHDVTFDDGPASGDPAKSDSFSRTFASPGTYNFFCSVHQASRPPMRGTVTVK